MIVIEATTDLPSDLGNLVRQSEEEGFNFIRRLKNEWDTSTNRFDGFGEFLLAAYSEEKTIGVCGVNVDPYSSKQGVARLRHLYVAPANRSNCVGSDLVKHCLGNLPSSFNIIRLRVPNAETGRFYERLGFELVDDATATHVFSNF